MGTLAPLMERYLLLALEPLRLALAALLRTAGHTPKEWEGNA